MNTSPPRQHVLLIGIDAYQKVDPLYGSVNDVDSLERLFLDRLQVHPSRITKLVAPHEGHIRSGHLREDKPTSANIRQALEHLASDVVQPDDRVFIHYSGHGTQVFSRINHAVREALVPVDARAGGELLFDDEINDLLRRIAERTQDLTVVIDACCSAGTTRSAFVSNDQTRNHLIRRCSFEGEFDGPSATRSGSVFRSSGLISSLDPSDPGFLVLASAQSSEAAHEGRDARGVRHGAFTAALLDVLAGEQSENLANLRWVDIWPALQARVTSVFPGQHPCLIGRRERRVFGGPYQKQDPGFPIREINGVYHIQAGSMVGLGVGAQVAIYGTEPAFFPPLNSTPDQNSRLALLRIERSTLHSAVAQPEGKPFVLPEKARGRLVKPGIAEKLVVGLDPFDAKLAQYLAREAPVLVLPLANVEDHVLEAVVGLSADGSWWLGDDVFGADAPLARGSKGDWASLSRGLWHCLQYNLPLRLARQSRNEGELLRLRVLDARQVAKIESDDWHDPALPEVEPDDEGRFRYRAFPGQEVCFSVENRSSRLLYLNLFNCASSGKVEMLGPAQLEVPPRRRQTFWQGGLRKIPFRASISRGRTKSIDRLIAVGTSSPTVDLHYLQLKWSFAEALSMTNRDVHRGESRDICTAAMVMVKIELGSS
jgi:Caspase domain